jgi:hypothetical protein
MSKHFAVYNSNEVNLIVANIPILDGRADPFVEISKAEPLYEVEEGSDGHACRSQTNSRLYVANVTLKGSSKENAKLSALAAIDTEASGGAGVGAFLLGDLNGSTKAASPHCWIAEVPDFEMGKKRGDVTWVLNFLADPKTIILGGNGTA